MSPMQTHLGLVPHDAAGVSGSLNIEYPRAWAERLKEPFGPNDLEWKIQIAGETERSGPWALIVPYVSSRAIMDRLDEVCGIGAWRNAYLEAPTQVDGMMCGIGLLMGDTWVWKWDGTGAMGDGNLGSENAVKGTFSNAFKRAAVLWGIGRYLYSLTAVYADIYKGEGRPQGDEWTKAVTKGKPPYYWRPPATALPIWAQPTKGVTTYKAQSAAEERENTTPRAATPKATVPVTASVSPPTAKAAVGFPYGPNRTKALDARKEDGSYLFSNERLAEAAEWCEKKEAAANSAPSEGGQASLQAERFLTWQDALQDELERRRGLDVVSVGEEQDEKMPWEDEGI